MDYQKPCQYSIRLIDKLKSLDTKNVLDFDLINKAIYWAKKYHGDQKRKSGEAYYTHPLEVAYMISEYKLKTDVIVASILHDIIEDTEVTAGMILDNFGWRITEIVDRLTRDRPDGTKLSVEEILSNAYEFKDEEVLLIKLLDRLHNLSTLDTITVEKKQKIALETLSSFLAIALSFDEQGDQMIAKLCFSHLQLNYSQPSFSFSNFCKLKPIEFDF
ncbi:MAG: bifunctional (p)ppGpp synthetase/guanosine-3',5'-bis(diphosphate) 3'-pyrophosphohydrolase [Alphaproteobacteria bacterium]|nr:bifunctional (p)ppGpp synthetase/guanosine-3',5'-bis(diphosphate) 3'-pyrophosphohydrolase [Alphaproteobacteria bacterium]